MMKSFNLYFQSPLSWIDIAVVALTINQINETTTNVINLLLTNFREVEIEMRLFGNGTSIVQDGGQFKRIRYCR